MNRLLSLIFVILLVVAPARAASPYSDAALIDGFNRTVFGSEYSNLFSSAYVHKFAGPVRFFVRSDPGTSATAKVHRFIASLDRLIAGLSVQLVRREEQANFVVHIVKRRNYATTVRDKVYKRKSAPVVGRCMVRAVFSPKGIMRSDAVIVADQGTKLLERCMTEEILQGLGPLNDDRTLKYSMFNDTSRFTSFRRFDRFILNMLYDRAVKNGATQKKVQAVLPGVVRRARRNIEGAK